MTLVQLQFRYSDCLPNLKSVFPRQIILDISLTDLDQDILSYPGRIRIQN
jgi:hypothetical protein